MDDVFQTESVSRPGFRLHKLEVYNWGTFDSTNGNIHTVRPTGQTTLLIGQNGSGKSTLVDALLTLLVRPVIRNYNVAAGAQKQERDERTYIKGACGRFSRDEDNRADVQFLRTGSGHYSSLLACFRNESTTQAFTIALLLYLNADGRADKIYCHSTGERSIAADFAGLATIDRLRQKLQKRGFRVTSNYTEYHSWFAKATGVRPKAMDVFNQTVAVKDIQSLNRFIRDHMLEAKAWGEKVESLLNHFTQLSEAHQSLVRVRRQFDLLEPVAREGEVFREHAGRLERVQRLLSAADSFFSQKTVELHAPVCAAWRAEIQAVGKKKDQLGRERDEVQEECRRLQNEIDQAGGERLRQIPLLIQNHSVHSEAKRDASRRYHEALGTTGLAQSVTDAIQFAAAQGRLAPLFREIETLIEEGAKRRDEIVIDRSSVSRALRNSEEELKALEQRQGNLPENLAQLRRQLCDDLRLPEKELPFAAELIAVKPEERDWQASIEMVLRNFGLSLLVPERRYHLVSRYVDQTRLVDARGGGQKLVYLRIGERLAPPVGPVPDAQSMPRKLNLREGHPFLPWIRAELEERFNYRCCETPEEFQEAHGLALTRQRHVKLRGVRHEKDDRERTQDPRNYVLGWDNREKRRFLADEIGRLREQHQQLDRQINQLESELTVLRVRQASVAKLQEFTDFDTINYRWHEQEIASLRLEKRKLEEQSDTIRLLKQRLGEAESRQQALQAARDAAVARERELERDLQNGERLVANAKKRLADREADNTLANHTLSFPDLDACFVAQPLTAANLFEQAQAFRDGRQSESERLRQEIEPLRSELIKLMTRFLREFPEERTDLEAEVTYLNSFLDLREQVRREDLPRHELRFKERLNEKVIQEIGLLNGAFQSERTEIESKIDLLNQSLQKLEYRRGTHMRLEPRPVRDGEIAEFQNALKECLAGTFEGTLEADEARFLRIEKLIARLREDQRWREKVTDVRRWFDFAAREIDRSTGAERGYYEDSTGQSGGEKAKLAFTILVAAIAYQYDIDPDRPVSERFHFVVVDEMFSKVDDQYAEYALELFRKFGLQLLIVAPLDAKARVTEPYVGCYLHVVKDVLTSKSEVFSMTAREFEESISAEVEDETSFTTVLSRKRPR